MYGFAKGNFHSAIVDILVCPIRKDQSLPIHSLDVSQLASLASRCHINKYFFDKSTLLPINVLYHFDKFIHRIFTDFLSKQILFFVRLVSRPTTGSRHNYLSGEKK